jgi:hypothetical protein
MHKSVVAVLKKLIDQRDQLIGFIEREEGKKALLDLT